MAPTMQAVEWKYVGLVAGEQCVMKNGTEMMLSSHVDSWDLKLSKQFLQGEDISVMLVQIGQFTYHKLNVKEMMMN